ncbi:MAG: T9SS type A sorting domain-containing protein [Bacteroidota bacterium]
MKKFLLLPAILLFSLCSFAQNIQNIEVIPASPTSTDNISIAVDYMFTSGPCDPVNQYYTMSGNDIFTFHYHCPGMLTVICYGTDILPIGQLAPGNYMTYVNMFQGDYDSTGNCNVFQQVDGNTFSFVVSLGTGIDQLKNSRPIVFMNSDAIKISNLNSNYQFVLMDVSGKEVLSQEVTTTENNLPLSVEAGVYFYSLRKEGKQEFTGKLVVGK